MINFNRLEKSVLRRLVVAAAVLMGVLFATVVVYQPFTEAAVNPEDANAENEKVRAIYPRIVAAMKTSMYSQVADDEDIEIMAQWIEQGGRNDDFFKNEVYPIIKNDCLNCHSKTSTMTKKAPHIPFRSYADIKKFTKVGPTSTRCLECHGSSALKDLPGDTFTSNFVDTARFETSAHKKLNCIRCHVILHPETVEIYQDPEAFKTYIEGGKALADSERPEIFRPNCTNCHPKENQKLAKSAHAIKDINIKTAQLLTGTQAVQKGQKPVRPPGCGDCHGAQHYITDVKLKETKFAIVKNCGSCHEKLLKTYFASYHGKAEKLGSDRVAKCANCHGTHDMQVASNPASKLNDKNILNTCQECHPKATAGFTGYLPHADKQDRAKNPLLFYSFWGMTLLIVLTFAVFGTHSVLWLNRSLIERFNTWKNKEKTIAADKRAERHVKRFKVSQSILHLMIMVSFLTLAFTGMALKYADNPVFKSVNDLVGGPHVMGKIHMAGALIALLYVSIHLYQLAVLFLRRKLTVKGLFREEYSMILLPRDFKELKANLLYFIGKGPKPEFGRWTYWEKFDYLAELWGTIVIGVTGLMLAFPEFTTKFLPGLALNIATIIHSFEALLATGFIFTIHFFNSHLRPENFPMDTVIFNQRLPLSRFKEERPREYRKLVDDGELEKHLADPPGAWYNIVSLGAGWFFLSLGLIAIGAIIYSLLSAIRL
jgi:cytochrome b subunit of formate dehydrogenase/nitrate reductase cytochrome c-type subunit